MAQVLQSFMKAADFSTEENKEVYVEQCNYHSLDTITFYCYGSNDVDHDKIVNENTVALFIVKPKYF